MDTQKMLSDMLDAVKSVLQKHWQDVKPFAEQEFKALTNNLVLIETLKNQGKINEEQAKLYLDIYKSSVKIVLLTIEGLGILAVEAAINAALKVVKGVVNTAIGFELL